MSNNHKKHLYSRCDGFQAERLFECLLVQKNIPFSTIPFRANNPTLKFSVLEVLFIALYIATGGENVLPYEFRSQTSYQILLNINLTHELVCWMDQKLHGFLLYLNRKVDPYFDLSDYSYTAFFESLEKQLFFYTTLEETFDSLFGTDIIMGIYTPNLTWVAVDLTMQEKKIAQKNQYMQLLFPILNQIFGIHKTAIIHFDPKKSVPLTAIFDSVSKYPDQNHFVFY